MISIVTEVAGLTTGELLLTNFINTAIIIVTFRSVAGVRSNPCSLALEWYFDMSD
jgi:hypothetical protein